jgi:cobalt/nickel transport system permease protein
MENKFPSYLLGKGVDQFRPVKGKKRKFSFVDKTLMNAGKALKSIYLQSEASEVDNFIQKINPRIKFISLIYMAVIISFVHSPVAQMLITAFIITLYIIARLKILEIFGKILLLAFIFGFLIILPAALNIITPGDIVINVVSFSRPRHFLGYDVPQNIGFTLHGIQLVALIFLRVLNSVSMALLMVFTTSFPEFIKSFKVFRVPDTFLMILSLAYKYIFILARTIEETYFAFKSRLSGNIRSSSLRKLIGGRIFFIFRRSTIIYENTYHAMVSRGYRGQVALHARDHFSARDLLALLIIISVGIVALAI